MKTAVKGLTSYILIIALDFVGGMKTCTCCALRSGAVNRAACCSLIRVSSKKNKTLFKYAASPRALRH